MLSLDTCSDLLSLRWAHVLPSTFHHAFADTRSVLISVSWLIIVWNNSATTHFILILKKNRFHYGNSISFQNSLYGIYSFMIFESDERSGVILHMKVIYLLYAFYTLALYS